MRHNEAVSLGDLFSELSEDTSRLIHQEVMLAKAEISQKVSRAGKDVIFLAVGAVIAYTGVLTLTAALILIVSLFMPSWVAASVIGLIILGIGYFLVQKGLNDLKKVPPMPEKTIQTLKEDKIWLQQQVG